jgi:hypothetical protein
MSIGFGGYVGSGCGWAAVRWGCWKSSIRRGGGFSAANPASSNASPYRAIFFIDFSHLVSW